MDGTAQWQTSISPVGALGLVHVGTAADLRSMEHSRIYEDSRNHQKVYDAYDVYQTTAIEITGFTVYLHVVYGYFMTTPHYSMEFMACESSIHSSKVSKGSLQGVGGPLQRTLQLHKDWVPPGPGRALSARTPRNRARFCFRWMILSLSMDNP